MYNSSASHILNLTEKALHPNSIVSGKCFLCGGDPTTGQGEHVFPKWLQRRHGLWNESLNLLNGSSLQYRSLRVPACESCNSRILGRTESYVSSLRGSNVSSWQLADSFEVGRWLSKVFVGILFSEARLLRDPRNPELGSIFHPKWLREVVSMHLLVQSWRKVVRFRSLHAAHPFTLYVYSIDQDRDFRDFNVSTNLLGRSICIRFGDLGFAFVADGGLQHAISELGPYNLAFERLHPVQFDELAARVHYKASLCDASHAYAYHESEETFEFEQLSVSPYGSAVLEDGSKRVFREWSLQEFWVAMKHYGVPGWEFLIDKQGMSNLTRLADDDGEKLYIPPGIFTS